MNQSLLKIESLLEEIFPEASIEERANLNSIVFDILEGKDIGKFKGEISGFKKTAIDTAAALPRAATSRRFLEKDAVRKLDRVVKKLNNDLLETWRRFQAGKISNKKFREGMKSLLRIAYTDAYRLGTRASGLVRATDLEIHLGADEKRWLENVFSEEQKHFNKFLDELSKGKSKTKATNRIKNYAEAVRSVFESSKVLQLPDNVIIYWVLESPNPCPECQLLHKLSPFVQDTLPTTPKGGSTRCRAYCWCKLRIVKGKPSEIRKIRKKNKSAKHLLKLLKDSMKTKPKKKKIKKKKTAKKKSVKK